MQKPMIYHRARFPIFGLNLSDIYPTSCVANPSAICPDSTANPALASSHCLTSVKKNKRYKNQHVAQRSL